MQPHASLIQLLSKGIETRSWCTNWRGRLLIHASASKLTRADREDVMEDHSFQRGLWRCGPAPVDPDDLPLGAVIAWATLDDCICIPEGTPCPVKLLGEGIVVRGVKLPPDGDEREFGDYTPGRFAWILRNIVPIVPVPWKGQRGLWRAPDELVRRAERETLPGLLGSARSVRSVS